MKIQMKADNTTAEVLLYESIGMWGVTADSFAREVKKLPANVKTINLRINSDGGNVFDGVAIYNYLKSHKARIEVDVDALAGSIASIIAMAGDEIRIADNAWMMIHDPWILTGGTADQLRDTATTMDGIRETLLETYMARAKIPRDDVSEMMRAETWINAKDAVTYGFADGVTGAMQMAACVRKDLWQHVPEALVNKPSPRALRAKEVLAKMSMTLRKHGL